jgi:opacity protein-like surface antigen
MYVSGLLGADFGGDSGCQNVSNCQDRKLNEGVAVGSLGLIGFEEELAYAKDFFGSAPGLSTNVITIMTNVMVAPAIGPVHPYALAGVGLIKTHVEFASSALLSTTNNNFGWDIGGGAVVFLVPHIGLRGDLRYFHALQELKVSGFTFDQQKLDFGRAAAALVLSF